MSDPTSMTPNLWDTPVERALKRQARADHFAQRTFDDITAAAIHAEHEQWMELARYRRVTRESIDILTDALHALRAGDIEVTDEFLDRTIIALGKVRRG